MERLFPDKQISKSDFSGILMIEGDLGKNCIQFSFIFDKSEMIHPLLIWIKTTPLESFKDSPKEYRKKYACNVRDINNPVMKQVKSSLELTRYPVYQECFDRE